jgi:class 3 adenylate cyclase/tetratricopeptide (TPR) repeat protein
LVTRSDERRVATVLFADLVGFTSLSERSDPEQIKNLVDRCFARLARDITDFGGQVDKIMGDALIALFGAPVAHEDDAERAVRAALRMQTSLAEFQTNADVIVQMRVGVNTGEVLVGSLRAGGEYTAMGDVVNTAQRLQAGAVPGTVVVGPSTFAATRGVIEYESLGELQAKGRDAPVEAWLAREPLLPPGYRRRRRETPFVGRDPEIGLLGHAIDAAFERERGQLVLLVGEAGVGKSRLAEEAARRAATNHDALVVEGRCVPYGEANVWWPVAEAIRQACSITTEDALPEADRLAVEAVAAVLALPAGNPEVKRIVNGLLYLMGYEVSLRDIDPQRAREEGVRSALSFLEASARRRPVVLVVSDLHWADDLVLETIDALLDRLRSAPFVFIATARQELYLRWTVPHGRHNSVTLNLDPLDRSASGYLLGSLVDHEISGELRDALLDRSGGNPFYLEELVALLAEDRVPGMPAIASGTSGSSGEPGSLTELPDTLRGLVAARLDGLLPSERNVLEDASVWGRSGPIKALEEMVLHVHGMDDLRSALDALVDKEILVVDGQRWSFHSDLIREVAYGTLTKADRARRHYGIAKYLEATEPNRHEASDRLVDVIAHHYGAATELVAEVGSSSGVPDDIAVRALDWIEVAAKRAEIASALPVSARLYGQALRILGNEPGDRRRRVHFLLGRAAAETDLRELDAARNDIDDAILLASEIEDPELVARAMLALGELEQKADHLDVALTTVGQAIERFRQLDDQKGLAGALRVLGMTQLFRGDYPEAESSITAALDASRRLGDRRGEAWALQNLAGLAFIEGRTDDAEARLEASADTFRELGDSGGLSWAMGLMAFVRFHQGHLAAAEELGARILVEARERGDRWGQGMMLLLIAGARLWSGRSQGAVAAAEESLAAFEALGDRFGTAQAIATTGRSLVIAGRVDDGLHLLRTSLDGQVAIDGDEPDLFRSMVAMGLTAAATHVGDVTLALDAVSSRPAAQASETIGDREGQVSEALALLQQGRVEAAIDLLLPIIDALGDQPGPYARSVLALALAADGRRAEVVALADEVAAAPRATYLDRAFAAWARFLVCVDDGAGIDGSIEGNGEPQGWAALSERFVGLATEIDAADDQVSRAITRLAAATAYESVGHPDAIVVRRDAEDRLDDLGIDAIGWRTLFGAILEAGPLTAGHPFDA